MFYSLVVQLLYIKQYFCKPYRDYLFKLYRNLEGLYSPSLEALRLFMLEFFFGDTASIKNFLLSCLD